MHLRFQFDGRSHDVRIEHDEDSDQHIIVIDDERFVVDARRSAEPTARRVDVTIEDEVYEVTRSSLDEVRVRDAVHRFRIEEFFSIGAGAEIGAGGAAVRPPMPGKVVALKVHEGQVVEAGEVLLVLEAMKMQNEVTSPARARVERIVVESGTNVDTGDTLIVLGPVRESPDGEGSEGNGGGRSAAGSGKAAGTTGTAEGTSTTKKEVTA